ncbi:MAG: ABC transporter ATP-binding protein [Lachnospiraceae bacterium]|nr:ABC transporter ATP-binding protein [Lachnospiraceae bacterium]
MEGKTMNRRGNGMGAGMKRPGGLARRKANNEKIEKGTWGKLLKYCKQYWIVIILAIACAAGGTILTLMGPDKLSEIADTVTEGIAPDTDKLQTISESISDNMEKVIRAILANMAAQGESGQGASDIEVNGVTISAEDQMNTMSVFRNMSEKENGEYSEEAVKAMEQLPESVKNALYTDITVDGATITAGEQRSMLDSFSNADKDQGKASLKAFDELPQSVYDLVKPSIDMDKVLKIVLFLAAIYLIGAALSAAQGWIMATVTQKVSRKLRSDISVKINRLPMSYYHHNSTGDVLSRVTNDVDTIGMSLNMSVGTMVSAVTLFLGSLFMMLKTNVIMTITGVLATMLGFALMMMIMGHSQKYFTRQQRNLGAINGHIEEIYSSHTVVKAYNGEEKAKEEFDRLNYKLKDSGFKAQALSGLMNPIMVFIGNFGYVAVCVVGAALALQGEISFGVIVSFMMYIRFFTQPLSQIAQAFQQLQSAGAASSRVFEFLEAEEMEDESNKNVTLQNTKGDVSFSHVRFGYEPGKIIIKDFSAEAKAGQKIAIVGPTGAGKTTMVNLLMRFYEINGGEIKIDGVSTKEMKREEVHSQFCMVLQDTWLFEGTIRENLIYCSENKSEEKMEEACKAVGLDHFIRTLPDGYDTVLNDQINLSQGQKQQLTIARAMIADKPILILDEATSSIDTRTEQKIQNAMDELMKGRTSFVIAHRLSTIKNADLILVLKDGDVIESGNHEELMKQSGFYAELYNSQFEQAS